MFGRSIHVAPVVAEGAQVWPAYLPESEGGWFDLWTGEHRSGGRVHNVAAPLEQIPLHGRAGSILALGPVLQSTAEATDEAIDLYVIPGRDAAFDLYEDDGLSNAYETGGSAIIPIHWDDRRGEIEIGKRRGSFAGMRIECWFAVHRVGPGVAPMIRSEGVTVDYSGVPIRYQLA